MLWTGGLAGGWQGWCCRSDATARFVRTKAGSAGPDWAGGPSYLVEAAQLSPGVVGFSKRKQGCGGGIFEVIVAAVGKMNGGEVSHDKLGERW